MGLFGIFKKRKPLQSLSTDAQDLFAEIARDANGELVKIRMPGQVIWDTNGKQFVDEIEPSKEGRWKAAVDELVGADLLGPIGRNPHRLYVVTKNGASISAGMAR